jgi:acyl-CoA thioester hydrolase
MTGKPFYTELPIDVKTYDIDAIGHVSNIVYIRWLEDMRLLVLKNHLPLDELMKNNLSPILIKTEIEYKRPIQLFDNVMLKAFISGIKGIRMFMDFEFYVDDVLMARAKQTGIFITMNNGKPAKLPQKIIDALAS